MELSPPKIQYTPFNGSRIIGRKHTVLFINFISFKIFERGFNLVVHSSIYVKYWYSFSYVN